MEKVRATFAEIDKDKSGTVDEAELTNLLKKHAENAQRAAQVSKVIVDFPHLNLSYFLKKF